MPQYFFDLVNGGELVPDEEGTEISCLDELQNEAAYTLADMLRDEVRETNGNPLARDLMFVVRDTNGPVMEAKYLFQITRLQ